MGYAKLIRRLPPLGDLALQGCAALLAGHTTRVVSSNGNGSYSVYVRGAQSSCTCPGMKFHGKCRHVAAARLALCGWQAGGELAQTPQQQVTMACPACGGPTQFLTAQQG